MLIARPGKMNARFLTSVILLANRGKLKAYPGNMDEKSYTYNFNRDIECNYEYIYI